MHQHAAVETAPAPSLLIRPLATPDLPAVSALHAHVFGPGRFARTAYRVREGTPPVTPFCRGAFVGTKMVASIRLTPITIGGAGRHLLLGPLAVSPDFTGQGYGRALVADVLASAEVGGVGLVVLVGDESYYGRFGFTRAPTGQITFPGPVNPTRILVRETTPGALAHTRGPIAASPFVNAR